MKNISNRTFRKLGSSMATESNEIYQKKIDGLLADFEQFAHVTSHDLRDPLRKAIANCETLLGMGLGDEADTIIKDNIDSIDEVITRVAILRKYSYLVKKPPEFEPVDCNAMLKEIEDELCDLISKKGATIEYSNLPTILGCGDQLIVLFKGLIENAIKFNDSIPPVVRLTCEEKDNHWLFSIADEGIGMDNVYRKLIFALFRKIDPDSAIPGYGAGLAFCKKVVENHKGEIWMESEDEEGTTMFFTIPKELTND